MNSLSANALAIDAPSKAPTRRPLQPVTPEQAAIHAALEYINPVPNDTPMLSLLDIFRQHQDEHFFPVLDAEGRPQGIVCERSLKSYVYSPFGMALLANPSQPKLLEQFLTPCPCAEISEGTAAVLDAAHEVPHAEGVIITHQRRYAGFVRASSLVDLAHARQLETVRQHNAELDLKNREIQAVLQNMRQGICTVMPDLTLHPDYSAHLVGILEREALAGARLDEVLFRHSDLGADRLQQVETALQAVLGQDEMMYACNEHLLPTELTAVLNSHEKILELHWRPVLDDQDEVSSLMLVVRDITRMRELQQQAEQQQQELVRLGEVLATGEARFKDFIGDATAQLAACDRELAQNAQGPTDQPECLAAAYRRLHTVKGNARTLGLLSLTDALHDAEQHLQQARDPGQTLNRDALQQALQNVRSDLEHYYDLYQNQLQGFGQSVPDGARIVEASLWEALTDLALTQPDGQLAGLLRRQDVRPLGDLLRDTGSQLDRLATELGKPEPRFIISATLDQVHIRAEHQARLTGVFVHLLRNNMDHGIESPQDRLAAGKPPQGEICIAGEVHQDGMRLRLSDDGPGLALTRLQEKAIAAGLLSADAQPDDDALAELIFHSGLTTAEQVSMVSGRGVGMDAVRASLAEMDAAIGVEWLPGSVRVAGRRRFSFCIDLPRSAVDSDF